MPATEPDVEISEALGYLINFDDYLNKTHVNDMPDNLKELEAYVPELLSISIMTSDDEYKKENGINHPLIESIGVEWSCHTKKMLFYDVFIVKSQENFEMIYNNITESIGEGEYSKWNGGFKFKWSNSQIGIILLNNDNQDYLTLSFINFENYRKLRDKFHLFIQKENEKTNNIKANIFK